MGRNSPTHRDELEDETQSTQIPHVILHLLGSQTRRIPIEARAQIVRQPLPRSLLVDPLRKLLGLRVDRALGLHPQQIRIRGERHRPIDRALRSPLVPEEPLARPRRIPIPVRRRPEAIRLLRELERRVPGRMGGPGDLGEKGGDFLPVHTLLAERVGECLGVELEFGGFEPVVLDRLEGGPGFPLEFRGEHEVDEREEGGVGGAEDEGVVARVDVGGDQRGGLGVGARDDEVGAAHDVALETHSNEAIDVFGDGNEDL